jgi:hypothetical protein
MRFLVEVFFRCFLVRMNVFVVSLRRQLGRRAGQQSPGEVHFGVSRRIKIGTGAEVVGERLCGSLDDVGRCTLARQH